MKTTYQIRNIALAAILLASSLLAGCDDMFKDPLTDKETGEPITLLLMDMNFLKTRIAIQLKDLATGQTIEDEQIEIRFSGEDAANLINFGGYKNTSFTTNEGLVEAGYDPGIAINAQNPIELTVVANSVNYISAPQFISYTSEGIKNVVIKMVRKTSLKSASMGAFGEPFDMSFNGQVQSPGLIYIADFSGAPTGTAYQYINLYTTGANGTLLCNNLKDNVLYADYGSYIFNYSGGTSVLPPALPTKNMGLKGGDYLYSTVLKSGMGKCEKGLTLHVERDNGAGGSAVLDYRLTFSNGDIKTGKISCVFPSDILIEQLYYPTSNAAVKVELMGDAQYDLSAAVNLNSPCGTTASFVATPKANLKNYKLITRYSCPQSSVGMGLTVNGEFKKIEATSNWTAFKFTEGISELQLVGESDYYFRINIDGEYYTYIVPTDPVKVKSFLEKESGDFTFRNLSIITNPTSVTITTDIQFTQAVCDIIN